MVSRNSIFLDNNSTTKVDDSVLEFMLPYFSEYYGNAASRTHAFGWQAADAVDSARAKVARLIHAEDSEIIFTSGSTESINLALKGAYMAYSGKGNHVVTVKTEHKAVLDTCKTLENAGAEVTYLNVGADGNIDLDALSKSMTPKTILVAVMYANNETGLIHPISEIAAIAHRNGSILFCDATQAAGKIHLNVQQDGIDLMCLSAHKMHGPKGCGALYVRRKNPRVSLIPLIDGGGHENGLRSGTLNVPGIAGMGEACRIAFDNLESDTRNIRALRDYLEQQISEIGGTRIYSTDAIRLPNTCLVSFEGIKADSLIKKLGNIAVATGSACTSALPEPSHVLSAMGVSEAMAYSTIRFSLGKYNTKEEIERVAAVLKSAVEELRKK